MDKLWKGFFLFVLGVSLGFNGSVIAGDITANGMSQGDLYTYLANTVTMVNEAKADFNLATAELNGAAAFADITGFTFGTIATTDLTLSGL